MFYNMFASIKAMEKLRGIKIARTFTYKAYRDYIIDLFNKGKTTGENQSESYLHYTKMNIQRMQRWEKKIQLDDTSIEKLKSLKKNQTWVVFSEAWCGDAAPNLPLFNAMASFSDKVELLVLLRDENPEIMDHYLTNGGKAIPKLIIFEDGEEKGSWGPRPQTLQKMVIENKNRPVPIPYSEFSVTVQKWYNKDKGKSAEKELICIV